MKILGSDACEFMVIRSEILALDGQRKHDVCVQFSFLG